MQSADPSSPPPPPGIIPALTAGFNAVAAQVGVILFPVGLDVFFWLGPRLQVAQLMAPILQEFKNLDAETAQTLNTPLIIGFWQNFSLFSHMRTFPLGVFSLMSLNMMADSPLGARPVWELPNFLTAVDAWMVISLVGWTLGALYFSAVARAALPGEPPINQMRATLHGILLAGLWAALALAAGIFFLFLVGILMTINAVLGLLVGLIGLFIAAWLFLPIYLSSYGIFTAGENPLRSLWSGLRLMRYGLPTVTFFALAAMVLGSGLDTLWRIPPADSWLTLVGILGHAFVSSGLLAASFIYYREMSAWIEAATRWLQKSHLSAG